jgi:glycosyltransferase involved in cell wall biosynthesis
LVGDFPPPYGGVSVHVESLLRAIRAAGGECAVLDVGKGQVPAEGVFAAAGHARFAALLAWFAARGHQIHLHTSGANAKSWLLAAAVVASARAAGGAALITLHSGLCPEWLDASSVRRAVAGAVLRRCRAVIAVSEPIAQVAGRCGVDEALLRVAPAFTLSSLEPGELPQAAAALRTQAAPLLCAMLAPGAVYGAEPLLRAFALVHKERPQARLLVFGPGTLPHELSPLAARLAGEASSHVLGLGEISRRQALAAMRACDLFLRPTLADGDSVSVREALALGRAVICTDVGTRPAGVHLVPPGDEQALAAAALAAVARGVHALPAAASAETELLQIVLPLYGLRAPERAGSAKERAA